MTIIVYDSCTNKVLVDRKHTHSDGRTAVSSTKVYRNYQGDEIALAGNGIPCCIIEEVVSNLLMTTRLDHSGRWLNLRAQVPGLAGDVWVSGFCKTAESIVYNVQFGHGYVDLIRMSSLPGVDCAEGSGRDWYNAYRAIGMSVVDSFDAVCRVHSACGDGYDEF